ncbi:TraY domain-containing protein [Aeromonas veronii]|jgi:uncharacterized protein YicC (UPF0701 family)
MTISYKGVTTVVQLDSNANRLLTEAAERSGRSKVAEATIRLRDHLKNFEDIAAEGKRFPVNTSGAND